MKGLVLSVKSEERTHTVIDIGGVKIGEGFAVCAGPCSVESEEQIMEVAKSVKASGAGLLRGGAFKPRSSPYSFQGLGRIGLEYLSEAGRRYGLPVVTEVMDTRDVDLVCEYADVLQIGARNMQNFSLLTEVGRTDKPVILKRGLYSTLEEWLSCAEYIMKEGNEQVILCERGIRTIETYTRNTLDLSIVTALKGITHLPVIVDPSHATGLSELIEPMSLCSVMAGADGLMVEVHPNPPKALSDARQQLTPEAFNEMMVKVEKTVRFRESL